MGGLTEYKFVLLANLMYICVFLAREASAVGRICAWGCEKRICMELYLIITIVGVVLMSVLGFVVGRNINRDINRENTSRLEANIQELKEVIASQSGTMQQQAEEIVQLSTRSAEQEANYNNAKEQLAQMTAREQEQAQAHANQLSKQREDYERQVEALKESFSTQLERQRQDNEQQLRAAKDVADKQIESLQKMNKEQIERQLILIKEQIQTSSEDVLKRRQDELGEQNREQVSKIIDPLQQSFRLMQEAFNRSKDQQHEALTRLDEAIKQNMQRSEALGQTADRLTRALTGEVKVQGNFGELRLRQLLEDLQLKPGEQYDTQESIKDKHGRSLKGDDGRGLIPDFILHFPNNRHVVVDAKMSLTDYERYMSEEDATQRSIYLKAHIESVKAQVKRLAKKEYSKYLPDGYNRLDFAIMYIPIEGAHSLALQNDTGLWRWAYDEGVMILGPQTMYMNLRVLEMMWTQVRQLKNQEEMIKAAETVIERVQLFGERFVAVESSVQDTVKRIGELKITTRDSGKSIITAAKNLIAAGAKERKNKTSLADLDDAVFLESESGPMLTPSTAQGGEAETA